VTVAARAHHAGAYGTITIEGVVLMIVLTGLPTCRLSNGFTYRPGDILGRTKFGSPFEHRFLVCFDGVVAHSPGPGQVFQLGTLQEVLANGGVLRVIHRSPSLEETYRRLNRANRLMGVSWWNMTCHASVDFIVCPQHIADLLVARRAA
jgi:hypothetical protein